MTPWEDRSHARNPCEDRPHETVLALLALTLGVCLPLAAQPDPNYQLTIESDAGVPGDAVTVTVRIILDDAAEQVGGFAFSVCDTPGAVVVDVQFTPFIANNELLVEVLEILPGEGWTTAVVIGSLGDFLDPGAMYPVCTATYALVEPGTWPVEFCPLGSPPVDSSLCVTSGGCIEPVEVNGEFVVTPVGDDFIRGDADGDGTFTGLVDGVAILAFQFSGGAPPLCLEAADADGNGEFSGLIDGVYVLNAQFAGGAPPPLPYPECGPDPEPTLSLGCGPNACP